MSELNGSIDDRGRPLLRVKVTGRDDELLLMLDSAFDGELLLQQSDAIRWGVIMVDVETSIELGDGSTRMARLGLVTIDWLGRSLDATVQVTADRRRPRREGEAEGLLGTGLLKAAIVTLDFPASRLTLATED